MEENTKKLRTFIKRQRSLHLNDSAILSSKFLVSLTALDKDINLLAQCYIDIQLFLQAIHLLDSQYHFFQNVSFNNDQAEKDQTSYEYNLNKLHGRFLIAFCFFHLKDYDSCLQIASPILEMNPSPISGTSPRVTTILASFSFLLGQVYENLENQAGATQQFRRAVCFDPLCFDALNRLLLGNTMTLHEEDEFFREIKTDDWYMDLVSTKRSKFRSHSSVQSCLEQARDTLPPHSLIQNEVLCEEAELLCIAGDYEKAHVLSSKILTEDPHSLGKLMFLHILSLVELNLHSELFLLAQRLVQRHPHHHASWYAVACHYFLNGDMPNARKYFSKSTTLNGLFGPSWLGYGHAFSREGEHDQAMAAYRNAGRIAPGSHLPLLYIGMELMITNNFSLSGKYLRKAHTMCPRDPFVLNELGVLAYRNLQFGRAVNIFNQSLRIAFGIDSPGDLLFLEETSHLEETLPSFVDLIAKGVIKPRSHELEKFEALIINIAHSYRKLGHYDHAIVHYNLCLTVSLTNSTLLYSALGFTYHLKGGINKAIEYYHKSLSMENDTLTNGLLNRAFSSYFIK